MSWRHLTVLFNTQDDNSVECTQSNKFGEETISRPLLLRPLFFSQSPLQNKTFRRHATSVIPAMWAYKSGIKKCCGTKQQGAIRRINYILGEIRLLVNFAFKREEDYKHHQLCVRYIVWSCALNAYSWAYVMIRDCRYLIQKWDLKFSRCKDDTLFQVC